MNAEATVEILAVVALQLCLVLAALRDVLEHPRMYLLILGLNYIILLVFWFRSKADYRRQNRYVFWILVAINPLVTFFIMWNSNTFWI